MGSNGQADELKLAIAEYESQLLQIKAAMTVTNFSGPEYDSLLSLEKDVTELIQLTKENLQNLEPQQTTISVAESPSKPKDNSSTSGCNDNLSADEEFARFKAEIEMLENGVSESGDKLADNGEDEEEKSRVTADIKNELAALQGTKCQAPYVSMKWDNEEKISYHNALVMSVEAIDASTSDIQDIMVRVMFVNPVHKKMVPCPYYLEGDCKFPDDKCHYSHGECIPFATLKEYREPDFSSIKVGSQVLAKHKDNLWHHANVLEIISDDLIKVKFNTSASGTLEIDLHEVLPLEDNSSSKRTSNKNNSDAVLSADPSGSDSPNNSRPSNASDESSDDDGDNEDDETARNTDRDAIVQLSLLRTPASSLFADWEKHTRGIGSRMMANMGYIVGSGLGPRGDGRLEPVEALVFPPGKSLDHCMNLRESSGGDPDMFKAEKRRLKMQVKDDKRREKEYEREKQKVDLFSFINVQLSGNSSGSKEATDDVSKSKTLASSSRKGLNVERFRISEDIRKAEKNLIKLKESLKRHQTGSAVHKHITTKVNQAENELNKLQASEQSIAREQNRRDSTKKLSVF